MCGAFVILPILLNIIKDTQVPPCHVTHVGWAYGLELKAKTTATVTFYCNAAACIPDNSLYTYDCACNINIHTYTDAYTA